MSASATIGSAVLIIDGKDFALGHLAAPIENEPTTTHAPVEPITLTVTIPAKLLGQPKRKARDGALPYYHGKRRF